jgi:hypothetical protein
MNKFIQAALVSLVAIGLSACSEKPQVLKSNKSDEKASAGAKNPFVLKGWDQGNATSWEAQLKKRAQNQDEYTKTN